VKSSILLGPTLPDGVPDGGEVRLEVLRLLRTGLLIQASSGGGKSWLLRRIAEQLFGEVPIIIIDPEGEFATLRERYDILLVGKEGDIPATVASAGALARGLLELRVSAVCDLFEMLPEERHAWVAAFIGAMVSAPKRLWLNTAVLVDEAHQFCSEKGEGESLATRPMTALASTGRKRGFGPIFATQRLAKLKKDAAAELKNLLIGLTVLDTDKDRASRHLGVARKNRPKFDAEIQHLEPGHFFALGPALCQQRTLVRIAGVKTTHREPGESSADAPPPTTKIRHLLPQLSDLLNTHTAPEEQDRPALLAELARLRREVQALRERPATPPPPVVVEVPVVLEEDRAAVTRLFDRMEVLASTIRAGLAKLPRAGASGLPPSSRPPNGEHSVPAARPVPPKSTELGGGGKQRMVRAEREILSALAMRHPAPLTKSQLAALAGYAPGGGGFNNALSAMKTAGFIRREGDLATITSDGLAALGQLPDRVRDGAALLDLWCSKLKPQSVGRILRWIAEQKTAVTKQQMAEAVGMDPGGGGFNNYVSTYRLSGPVA
jgi:uncharacterized protein